MAETREARYIRLMENAAGRLTTEQLRDKIEYLPAGDERVRFAARQLDYRMASQC